MAVDTLIAALILAGLANGVVIGAILLARNRAHRAGLALGALMLVAAAAGGLILFYGQIPPREAGPVLAAELALTWAAGPLLLLGVAGLTGQALARCIVLTALALAVGAPATASWLSALDPVVSSVLAQIGFTLCGWWLYRRRQPVSDRRQRRFRQDRLALSLLCAMSGLHGVQLARMVFPHSPVTAWAVPAALAVIMALAAGALLASAARLFDLGSTTPDSTPSPERARADDILRAHLADPDLTLDQLAVAAALPLADLRALYAADGGLAAAIRRLRIAKAAGELADPAEARTSIDAIALGCGFRSRSAFYAAFRRERGISPGGFRQQARQILS